MVSFFPDELMKEFSAVIDAAPKRTFKDIPIWISEERIEYELVSDSVSIPYRIYLLEPSDDEISKLTELQKQILYCIYTRSCNGYLREKYIRKLLTCDFTEWSIPYIVKLCDEYVLEILYIIYDSLSNRRIDDIKTFCMANKRAVSKGCSRMISYWNQYYRAENRNIKDYVGWKLFSECFEYDRIFEE